MDNLNLFAQNKRATPEQIAERVPFVDSGFETKLEWIKAGMQKNQAAKTDDKKIIPSPEKKAVEVVTVPPLVQAEKKVLPDIGKQEKSIDKIDLIWSEIKPLYAQVIEKIQSFEANKNEISLLVKNQIKPLYTSMVTTILQNIQTILDNNQIDDVVKTTDDYNIIFDLRSTFDLQTNNVELTEINLTSALGCLIETRTKYNELIKPLFLDK
jgi:hypothetical protein